MVAPQPGSATTILRQWVRRQQGRLPLPFAADGADEPQKRRLLYFWLDGFFASCSDSFVGPYLALYMLALGATGQQVGLLTAVIGFAGALMFLPGARLGERFSNHRSVVVFSSLGSRAMLALLVLLPWLPSPRLAIAALILLAALREGLSQFGNPAWTAFSALIVPERLRGRFFAARTLVWNLAALAVVPLAGRLIGALGSPQGYQVSFCLAAVAGLAATACYARIPLPATSAAPMQRRSLREALAELPRYPLFLRFWLISMLLNLGVQLAAPFLNVYLVRGLGGTVGYVGLVTTVQTAASLVGARFFGPLVDRKGLRWTMVRTSPFIALIPLAWFFASQPWHIIPLNIMAGLAWAGYNLATFNLLLASAPTKERPLYSAIFNTGNALTTMAGPLLGGSIYDHWGFRPCLAGSFLVRGAAAVLVFLLIHGAGAGLQDGPASGRASG